jgi:hypothetical protein
MTARPCMRLDIKQKKVPTGKSAPAPAFSLALPGGRRV